MRHLLYVLIVASCVAPLSAQQFQWHAAGGYEGPIVNSYAGATDIARDGLGRYHVFDYANLSQVCQDVRVTAHAERGNYSTFLYSFDADGALLRVLVVGEDFRALAIEADDDGSVYMLGRSPRGRLIVGADTVELQSHSNYLIKLSPFGDLVWNKLVFPSSSGAESMLLLHNNRLYVQSGRTSVDQISTAGTTLGTISASYYKSQTAVLQLIFKGAQSFSNGDLLFGAISYGDVAFGADTLRTRDNTFLQVPLLMIRVGEDMAVRWYRYVVEGLRYPDVHTIPFVVDQRDDIYAGLEIGDTSVVGTDTLINENSTWHGAVAQFDENGNGVWGRMWTQNVLPWSVAVRPNGTGVAMVGRISGHNTIGPFQLFGRSGQALLTLLSPEGDVDFATIAITGNYGTAGQAILADTGGTYMLGGLLNGGDGVPVYSCVPGEKIPGFFLGRISEAPDSVPQPSISIRGDSLVATPTFNGDIQWFLNGQPIPGATAQRLRILTNGAYTVQYAYASGCTGTATSDVTTITTSSVHSAELSGGIRVYPQPASEVLTVEWDATTPAVIDIIDVAGTVVATQHVDANHATMSVSDIAAGAYQLIVRTPSFVYSRVIITW